MKPTKPTPRRRSTKPAHRNGKTNGACDAWTPHADDAAFCRLVTQLCPEIDAGALLERLQEDRLRRSLLLRKLREWTLRGAYRVPASAVAEALLGELDPGWPA